jgi:putative ABC transport system ATP-binding protein
MARNLIRLEQITKEYLSDDIETIALSGVNLCIERGEYVSISGPSGCGKSTLLSIIGLIEAPSAGSYWFNDRQVNHLSVVERAKIRNAQIGFIFQNYNLISDLTVYENVELPLKYRGMSQPERKRRILASLDKVKMSHRAQHFPWQLSGGQRQRVAVARALAGDLEILLADEPTGSLDSKNGENILNLFERLSEDGATIVMVTHDARLARCAGRVIHLFDGKVVGDQIVRRDQLPLG